MKKHIIVSLLASGLLINSALGIGFSGFESSTLLRRTNYDIYGSRGTYSPLYELVQFDWQGKDNLGGSVYMRGRTGNAYYSNDPADLLFYSAYADWKVNDNLALRGGRQTIYQDTRIFSMDGLKFDVPTFLRPNVAVSAYWGRPAELYSADPGSNLLGLRTSIALRENASVGFNYQAEQKGGVNLVSIGGVNASATLGKVEIGALASYDTMRSAVKNYDINASLPVREGVVIQGKYEGQTPDFDPQSVYSVFRYSYQQIQHASAGIDYGLNENTNVYARLGSIAQDSSRGFDWRVGLGNKGGLLGYDTALDFYKTQGLDGDRGNVSCSASRKLSEKFTLATRLNYDDSGSERILVGGIDATVKPKSNVDLTLNAQSVIGGFAPNSKLIASAAINLGE